jgi:hypothetical protein
MLTAHGVHHRCASATSECIAGPIGGDCKVATACPRPPDGYVGAIDEKWASHRSPQLHRRLRRPHRHGSGRKGPDPPVAGKARRGRAGSNMWRCRYGIRPTPSRALLATGLLRQPRFAGPDAGAPSVLIDENDAARIQCCAENDGTTIHRTLPDQAPEVPTLAEATVQSGTICSFASTWGRDVELFLAKQPHAK